MRLAEVAVVYARTGFGHERAARTLARALSRRGISNQLIDLWDGSASLIEGFAVDSYNRVSSKNGLSFRMLFHLTNGSRRMQAVDIVGRRASPLGSRISPNGYRLVVSTHPVLTWQLASSRIPIAVLITDPSVLHSSWIAKGVSMFLCPSERVEARLSSCGIDDQHMVMTGFVVDEALRASPIPDWQGAPASSATGLTTGLLVCSRRRPPSKKFLDELVRDYRLELLLVAGDVVAGDDDDPRVRMVGWRDDIFDLIRNVDVVFGNLGPALVAEVRMLETAFVPIGLSGPQERDNLEWISGDVHLDFGAIRAANAIAVFLSKVP